MKLDLRRFGEAKDQKAELIKATEKAVAGIRVPRNRVLVATYVTPMITKGGIIRPDRNLDESRFQGKVGLVLKMGPIAFEFDDREAIEPPKPGDWVFYRAADTWECGLGEGAPCRFVYDDNIVGIIEDPELIW